MAGQEACGAWRAAGRASGGDRFGDLMNVFAKSKVRDVSKNAGFLRSRAKTRFMAKTSQDKKYINVYGGPYTTIQITNT